MRISDWSSDVCSSDLYRHCHRTHHRCLHGGTQVGGRDLPGVLSTRRYATVQSAHLCRRRSPGMSVLIRNARAEADDYGELPDGANEAGPTRRVIVTLERWQPERESLSVRFDADGVRRLDNTPIPTCRGHNANSPMLSHQR